MPTSDLASQLAVGRPTVYPRLLHPAAGQQVIASRAAGSGNTATRVRELEKRPGEALGAQQ